MITLSGVNTGQPESPNSRLRADDWQLAVMPRDVPQDRFFGKAGIRPLFRPMYQWLPTTRPGSFFATGSGGIGWGVPGAVGVALGDLERGVNRHIVATIGDGSFQYSIQAIWTAAQHKLPIVFVVLRNGAYAILKSFALLEKTPNVPALDLPGLDIASLATGFGCRTANVTTTDELAREFKEALAADGPTVIVIPTQAELPHLG